MDEFDKETSWCSDAQSEVISRISNKLFPCIFGRKALQNRTILWGYYDDQEDDLSNLVKVLLEYTNFVKNTPVEKRLLFPLIIVIKFNKQSSLDKEHQKCWEILQKIIDEDANDWPSDIPRDPNNSGWCLCFNEVQLFVNISAPSHEKLQSRNLGGNLCLVINPRENFDVVASGATSKGQKIRDNIRNTIPEALHSYGDKNNLEWQQYALKDDGTLRTNSCPLKIK